MPPGVARPGAKIGQTNPDVSQEARDGAPDNQEGAAVGGTSIGQFDRGMRRRGRSASQ